MPGHLIRRLNQQSTSVFQERMKQASHDLTSVQFAALDTLAKRPDIDQASLAKHIAYDPATIGGVVKRLANKGLIQRLPDEKDRRAFKLSLSLKGHALLGQVRPIVAKLQVEILPNLSSGERARLLELLEKTLGQKA